MRSRCIRIFAARFQEKMCLRIGTCDLLLCCARSTRYAQLLYCLLCPHQPCLDLFQSSLSHLLQLPSVTSSSSPQSSPPAPLSHLLQLESDALNSVHCISQFTQLLLQISTHLFETAPLGNRGPRLPPLQWMPHGSWLEPHCCYFLSCSFFPACSNQQPVQLRFDVRLD